MASLQPLCPIVAGSAEPSSQRSNAEQQLKENPTNRTIQWEELPKAATVTCPEDNTILWAELPKVTAVVTRSTSEGEMTMINEMVSVAPLPPHTAMVTSLSTTMFDTFDEMKTKTKAGMPELLPSCPAGSSMFEFTATVKQTDECLLDSENTWDEEIINTEGALHSKGHEDLEKQLMGKSSCPCVQYMPYYARSEIEYKQSSLSETYPSVTNIAGMPSRLFMREENWLSEEKPIWKKQSKTKDKLQPYASKDDKKIRKNMILLLPSCPRDAINPGFPSVGQNSFNVSGTNMVDIHPACASVSDTHGSPPISGVITKSGVSQQEPILEKKIKIEHVMMKSLKEEEEIELMGAAVQTYPTHSCISDIPSILKPTTAQTGSETESVLLLESNKMNRDIIGAVRLAQSCPTESFISGFTSVTKPRIIHFVDMTNMVSLSNVCPKVSQIPGFLSSHNSEDWIISRETLFKPRVKIGHVSIIDRCEKDERAMKAMVSLVPSCPAKARASGFPSHPYPQTVHGTPKNISLFTLCSQVSKIPGFPSVDWQMSEEWPIEKGSLLKRTKKKRVIFDTSDDVKQKKIMVSCVPSCPKKPIPGFPSIPNPKMVYFGLNVVNLLPMCPLVSVIPGFSSVEGLREEGWIVELGSLMQRPLKNIQFGINSSPINLENPETMFALVPSCPGASKIPGFASVPRYSMLSLVPVCPKKSSLFGFASYEGASKFQWIFDLHVLCDKPLKKTVSFIHSPNQDKETLKSMMALVPCCPEASRIPGFPSVPQTKPKIEPDMISFLSCCSSASSLKGFASTTNIQSTGWLHKTKPIMIKPQRKKSSIIITSVKENQPLGYNMKSMVTLVTCCPKKARACGFPSAQIANKPPNMVSLYTSAPCVSCVPGLPSVRMLSTECKSLHTRTTQGRSMLENPHNARTYINIHEHTLAQDEMKYMVAMAPSCPRLSQIPGLPSSSQSNPTEKDTATIPFLCCTEKHTSQEWSCDQSTQSYLKDLRIPDAPATCLSSSSTTLADGEILTESRFSSHSCLFGLFPAVYFTMYVLS